jgi:hypothetical protein
MEVWRLPIFHQGVEVPLGGFFGVFSVTDGDHRGSRMAHMWSTLAQSKYIITLQTDNQDRFQ